MAAGPRLTVALAEAGACPTNLVGGKAHTLGRLLKAGYRVPAGFCLTVHAYEQFVAESDLSPLIRMELGRKSLDGMRWEEIWDAALRIRAAFLATAMPAALAAEIRRAQAGLGAHSLAVRSSAPDEDSAGISFAGLHESLVGVEGPDDLLDAVRIVWSSLWSDAALLYRRELNLDVATSRMAVVVQEFIGAEVSGVAFGRDPRHLDADREMIEAVPGRCEDLVSGAVDPDRWLLERSSGAVVSWTPGRRAEPASAPVLAEADLAELHRTLHEVGALLGYDPDMEWTGRDAGLAVLQARPITGPAQDDTERTWYLSLRPAAGALRELCTRVTRDLIPELAALGVTYALADLDALSNADLAAAISERHAAHEKWQGIYRDEFIPFAHGVRRLGQYYNDAVRPGDPYEFVQILARQPLIASARNKALVALAATVRADNELAVRLRAIAEALPADPDNVEKRWRVEASRLAEFPAGAVFQREFNDFLASYLDLLFKEEALDARPDLVLGMVLELATGAAPASRPDNDAAAGLEARLLAAVGPPRHAEAQEVLRIARLSWQLRDDDNILMGRLEHQLQRAVVTGAARLRRDGRLAGDSTVNAAAAQPIAAALADNSGGPVALPPAAQAVADSTSAREGGVQPRQLIGQPAAAGVTTGKARIIGSAADFAGFSRGDIMVCDAIQPTMTHLVPLAGGIVERRGGMLIHGAIIARELGVPCVNGVADATRLLQDGDILTVDGFLGIVTVGEPEFGLESGGPEIPA